jgi:dienelactone hydrolase
LRDMARRLGTVVYDVLLPNLYYRAGSDTIYGPDVLDRNSADYARMRAVRTKARFSEVCRAADHEVLAFAAAVGNSDCAQLSRAIDTGEGDGTNGMRPCGRSDRLD